MFRITRESLEDDWNEPIALSPRVIQNDIILNPFRVGQIIDYSLDDNYIDIDSDTLTYTFSPELPESITIEDGILSGVFEETLSQAYSVTATNSRGLYNTEESIIRLTVTENTAPEVSVEIPDISIVQGQRIQLNLSDYFTDSDNDVLEYSVENNPGWLVLDVDMLAGTSTTFGTSTITITASDQVFETSDEFILFVRENNAPELVRVIPEQIIILGEEIIPIVLDDHFVDPDGDDLSYSTSTLPDGIVLDRGVIKGRPENTGTFNLKLSVEDEFGLSISTNVILQVIAKRYGIFPTGTEISDITIDLTDSDPPSTFNFTDIESAYRDAMNGDYIYSIKRDLTPGSTNYWEPPVLEQIINEKKQYGIFPRNTNPADIRLELFRGSYTSGVGGEYISDNFGNPDISAIGTISGDYVSVLDGTELTVDGFSLDFASSIAEYRIDLNPDDPDWTMQMDGYRFSLSQGDNQTIFEFTPPPEAALLYRRTPAATATGTKFEIAGTLKDDLELWIAQENVQYDFIFDAPFSEDEHPDNPVNFPYRNFIEAVNDKKTHEVIYSITRNNENTRWNEPIYAEERFSTFITGDPTYNTESLIALDFEVQLSMLDSTGYAAETSLFNIRRTDLSGNRVFDSGSASIFSTSYIINRVDLIKPRQLTLSFNEPINAVIFRDYRLKIFDSSQYSPSILEFADGFINERTITWNNVDASVIEELTRGVFVRLIIETPFVDTDRFFVHPRIPLNFQVNRYSQLLDTSEINDAHRQIYYIERLKKYEWSTPQRLETETLFTVRDNNVNKEDITLDAWNFSFDNNSIKVLNQRLWGYEEGVNEVPLTNNLITEFNHKADPFTKITKIILDDTDLVLGFDELDDYDNFVNNYSLRVSQGETILFDEPLTSSTITGNEFSWSAGEQSSDLVTAIRNSASTLVFTIYSGFHATLQPEFPFNFSPVKLRRARGQRLFATTRIKEPRLNDTWGHPFVYEEDIRYGLFSSGSNPLDPVDISEFPFTSRLEAQTRRTGNQNIFSVRWDADLQLWVLLSDQFIPNGETRYGLLNRLPNDFDAIIIPETSGTNIGYSGVNTFFGSIINATGMLFNDQSTTYTIEYIYLLDSNILTIRINSPTRIDFTNYDLKITNPLSEQFFVFDLGNLETVGELINGSTVYNIAADNIFREFLEDNEGVELEVQIYSNTHVLNSFSYDNLRDIIRTTLPRVKYGVFATDADSSDIRLELFKGSYIAEDTHSADPSFGYNNQPGRVGWRIAGSITGDYQKKYFNNTALTLDSLTTLVDTNYNLGITPDDPDWIMQMDDYRLTLTDDSNELILEFTPPGDVSYTTNTDILATISKQWSNIDADDLVWLNTSGASYNFLVDCAFSENEHPNDPLNFQWNRFEDAVKQTSSGESVFMITRDFSSADVQWNTPQKTEKADISPPMIYCIQRKNDAWVHTRISQKTDEYEYPETLTFNQFSGEVTGKTPSVENTTVFKTSVVALDNYHSSDTQQFDLTIFRDLPPTRSRPFVLFPQATEFFSNSTIVLTEGDRIRIDVANPYEDFEDITFNIEVPDIGITPKIYRDFKETDDTILVLSGSLDDRTENNQRLFIEGIVDADLQSSESLLTSIVLQVSDTRENSISDTIYLSVNDYPLVSDELSFKIIGSIPFAKENEYFETSFIVDINNNDRDSIILRKRSSALFAFVGLDIGLLNTASVNHGDTITISGNVRGVSSSRIANFDIEVLNRDLSVQFVKSIQIYVQNEGVSTKAEEYLTEKIILRKSNNPVIGTARINLRDLFFYDENTTAEASYDVTVEEYPEMPFDDVFNSSANPISVEGDTLVLEMNFKKGSIGQFSILNHWKSSFKVIMNTKTRRFEQTDTEAESRVIVNAVASDILSFESDHTERIIDSTIKKTQQLIEAMIPSGQLIGNVLGSSLIDVNPPTTNVRDLTEITTEIEVDSDTLTIDNITEKTGIIIDTSNNLIHGQISKDTEEYGYITINIRYKTE